MAAQSFLRNILATGTYLPLLSPIIFAGVLCASTRADTCDPLFQRFLSSQNAVSFKTKPRALPTLRPTWNMGYTDILLRGGGSAVYRKLTYPWASSLLGFAALALAFVPYVLLWKGKDLRRRSPYASSHTA